MKNRLFGKGLLDSTFSLKPLVDHLRQLHLKSIGPGQACELGDLLETVDRHPEILGRFKDFSEMGDMTDLGHQLISTVIPQATWDHEATAVFMPLRPYSFYASNAFRETLLDADGRLLGEPDIDSKIFARNLLCRAYLLILQKIYGIRQKSDHILIRTVIDPKTGLNPGFYFC